MPEVLYVNGSAVSKQIIVSNDEPYRVVNT